MPTIRRQGHELRLDLADLPFRRIIPWETLVGPEPRETGIESLRESLFEFMDLLEGQLLAGRREMCMNVVDGRVCQARALYVVERSILLCERCWDGYAGDDSAPLKRKLSL